MADDETTTRGIGAAKRLVADYVRVEFPAYLARLRDAWDLSNETLPDPADVLHNEPVTLDRWPRVAFAGTDRRVKRSPRSEGGVVAYDATYTLRGFVWVREIGWEEAIDVRDNLTAGLATLLMDHVTLGTPGTAVVQDDTLVESYSDVQPVKGERFVAGSYIEFQLVVQEVIVRDPLGTADTVSLLAHPAL